MKKITMMMFAMMFSLAAWSAMPEGYTFYTTTNGVSTAFTALSSDYKCAIGIAWNSTLRTSSSTPADLGAGISTDFQGSFVIPDYLQDQGYMVTQVGYKAFYKCTGITAVSIPSTITYIDYFGFDGCTGLTEVSIPGSVKTIDTYAFACCHNLTNLTLHEGIQTINADAFLGCMSLTSVNIPASVKTIGGRAFGGAKINHNNYGNGSWEGCDNIASVTVHWQQPISITSGTFSNAANAVLYVPQGTAELYANATGWQDFNEIIEISPAITFTDANVKALCVSNWDTNGDGELSEAEAAAVTDLGTVFQNNTTITSFNELQYFTGLTRIGNNAFYGCTELSSLTIPNSVVSIGEYALYRCTKLTTIEFPSSLTTIDRYAFYYAGIESLVVPDNVTSVGNSAFRNCTSLSTVKFSNGTVSFGKNVFRYCTSLTTVTFDGTICHFNGEDAFRDCSALKSAVITDLSTWCKSTFTYSGSNPLSVTKSLSFQTTDGNVSIIKGLVIPDDITALNNYAFYMCNSLESVIIPSGVTSIGISAFYGCTGLTSVTIPSSVTSIGSSAFNGCSNLTSVTVEATEPVAITAYVFSNRANATLYVPAGCKEAYEAADYWKEFKEIFAPLANGDTFTATTTEGVVVTYQVTDSESMLCQVGYTYEKNKGVRQAIDESTTGEVTIPSEVNGYTVKYVGDYAFSSCRYVTAIRLPESIVWIGKCAFNSCTSAVTISYPPTASFSDTERLFAGCESLKSIYLKEGLIRLGPLAFYNCKSLESVTLPSTLTSMGTQVFSGCSSLTSLILPDNIATIGYSALTNTKLTTLTLPASFSGITDAGTGIGTINTLNKVVVPNGVSSLYEVFKYCSFVETVICYNETPVNAYGSWQSSSVSSGGILYVPSGSKEAYRADDNWKRFATIEEMDPNVDYSSIGNTFGVDGITYKITSVNPLEVQVGLASEQRRDIDGSLIIPSAVIDSEGKEYAVTSIGYSAFSSCYGLTSITIPSSVTKIRPYSLPYGLTSVTVEWETPIAINEYVFTIDCANATLYVPWGCKAAYQAADYWKDFGTIVEMPSPLSVGDVFMAKTAEGVDMLFRVISDDECQVGYGCYDEQAIDKNCAGSITIPSEAKGYTVTSIASDAFSGCSGLTGISIPNTVTTIEDGAFGFCTSLSAITIPASVTSIVARALSTTVNTAITVEEDNPVYDSRDNCHAIIETETNTLIRGNGLTVIPNTVTAIGEQAFEYCYDLSSITIPNSVTSIGAYAFDASRGLTSITIPSSVTSIGEYAFDGIPFVVVERNEPIAISNAFSDCSGSTLYVPKGCKADYQAADNWKDFMAIKEYPDGDVNQDGDTDVVDVVDIARYVVGTPAGAFDVFLADQNGDKEVNVADAVVLVNEIAGDTNWSRGLRAPGLADGEEMLSLTQQAGFGLSLVLDNEREYTAFQFDLYVPAGTGVVQMLLNTQRKQKHYLLYNKVADGHYRVAAFSASNRIFSDNRGELLSITLDNETDDVTARNIIFFDALGNSYPFADISLSATTDINSIQNSEFRIQNSQLTNQNVYDVQGRRIQSSKFSLRKCGDANKVQSSKLKPGLYIINGKKVVIK